jgi:flagellar basal-body rod modification protein FlgD
MTLSQLNSLTNHEGAASRVASALVPKAQQTATAKAANTDGTNNSSTTDNSTITANDFLTLLVTELKNQDPTQPTDPNAYIQQLVGVNSLQQLIEINKGIGALGSTGTGS